MRMTYLFPAIGALLCFAAGCGGGDSKSSSTFSSTLPGTAVLATLTPSQVTTLCNEQKAFLSSSAIQSDMTELACRYAGVLSAAFSNPATDAAAQSACQSIYDQCKKSGTSTTTTSTCSAPDSTCMATVAELSACLNDTPNVVQSLESSVPSCKTLTLKDVTDASSGSGMQAYTSVPCATVQQKCPTFSSPISSMM